MTRRPSKARRIRLAVGTTMALTVGGCGVAGGNPESVGDVVANAHLMVARTDAALDASGAD